MEIYSGGIEPCKTYLGLWLRYNFFGTRIKKSLGIREVARVYPFYLIPLNISDIAETINRAKNAGRQVRYQDDKFLSIAVHISFSDALMSIKQVPDFLVVSFWQLN
jgi:hypothetical protein